MFSLLLQRQELIQNIWKDAGFDLLESHDRNWFRISMNPEDIFFNSELFDYELKVPEPKQWELILYVEQLNTPLGNIPESVFKCQLGTEIKDDNKACIAPQSRDPAPRYFSKIIK